MVNLNSLLDGSYEIEAYALGTVPLLLLQRFQITIINGVLNVSTVDVQATTLHVTIKRNDRPLNGARVLGTFTNTQARSFNLDGQTNNEGVITIVLSQGTIQNFAAEKDKVEVKKVGNITLLSPAPTPAGVPRPPKCIIIDVDSSSFSSSVNPINKKARVVILGDISGSMSSGTKMDILRRSFQEIFDKCQKNGWNVSLASWDTETDWCTEKWIQPNQIADVRKWIESQQPRGGNDMKTAIENCMERYADATDVYVMCDGNITPFVVHHGEPDWGRFRNQFPRTTFHFIALGVGASCEPMEAMATAGGGIFTHNT
ncbi:unnamed protein product [Didymodactylos carnosus]|uniref:VWFA domain-containing protein n=1 Tax=Didymodactylos carnosus TaxID=1234261 RepID=A0A813Z201_9BILA|nr:unnamed protein product [Didymodactylos carnosus]CAF3676314.1 unnamed protein product [Didymodactylos carnosus]